AGFAERSIAKSSSFLPDFKAAAIHRGLRPRPAHVSAGLSGLRYFGATAPYAPPRRPRSPVIPWAPKRDNFPSSICTFRHSSVTLDSRAASTCDLRVASLSIDIDFRLGMRAMGVSSSRAGCRGESVGIVDQEICVQQGRLRLAPAAAMRSTGVEERIDAEVPM